MFNTIVNEGPRPAEVSLPERQSGFEFSSLCHPRTHCFFITSGRVLQDLVPCNVPSQGNSIAAATA